MKAHLVNAQGLYGLTRFSAAGAEELTGVGVLQQRNWRRHGFLPPVEASRNASFHLPELCGLLAYQLLATRGIGPTAAQAIIPDAARGIMFHVLAWNNAYSGPGKWPERSLSWGEVSAIHRVKIMGQDGSLPIPLRHLVWWGDDTPSFADSLDAAVNGFVSSDPRVSAGAVVFIDLQAAASGLIARAAAPFVHVEVAPPVAEFDAPAGQFSDRAGLLSAF